MQQESSIITGKLTTETFGPGSTSPKKLYVKIFLGSFTNRPPRLKQAKVLRGELLIKYSGREWPEKKNGPLHGDPGVLIGVGELLSAEGYSNVNDIKYASDKDIRPLKDTLTLVIGAKLAKEFIDRGLVEAEESLDPMASRVVPSEPNLDVILPIISDEMNVEKLVDKIINVEEIKEKTLAKTDLLDLSVLDESSKPINKSKVVKLKIEKKKKATTNI